jgi:hypothetical protein
MSAAETQLRISLLRNRRAKSLELKAAMCLTKMLQPELRNFSSNQLQFSVTFCSPTMVSLTHSRSILRDFSSHAPTTERRIVP